MTRNTSSSIRSLAPGAGNFFKIAQRAVLVLPLLLTAACGGNTPLDQQTGFARPIESALYLRADGQKELRREVQYWAGSRNLKKVTVFYSEGGKQISVYRKDGSVQLLTEWYPEPALTAANEPTPTVFSGPGAGILPGIQTVPSAPSPAATPANTVVTVEGAQSAKDAQATAGSAKVYDPPSEFGKIKRSIEYGVDGKTIVEASFFREDGSLSAYGRSNQNGDFELNDYLRDGRSIARQQQFTRAGDVFYLRVVVGAASNTIVSTLKNSEATTTFGDNGIRTMRSTKPTYGMTEDVEFFHADGKSLKFVVNRAYKIEALYFKANGDVDCFRSFDSDGSYTLTKYRDNSGRVKPTNSADGSSPREAYRQYWQAKKDGSGNVSYELTRHEEIGSDGFIARRLTFASGKLVKAEYLNSAGQTVKTLTISATEAVEKIETYTYPPQGGAATVVSTEVSSASSMRESYDGRLLEHAPFEDVRPLVGPPLVPYYYDYEGY